METAGERFGVNGAPRVYSYGGDTLNVRTRIVTDMGPKEESLVRRYLDLIAAQTLMWQGECVPIADLQPVFAALDRKPRERLWRAVAQRREGDESQIREIWRQLVHLRRERGLLPALTDPIGEGLTLTARQAAEFHMAVEEFATAALTRLHEKRRLRLGLRTLRPWDLDGAAWLDGEGTWPASNGRSEREHEVVLLTYWLETLPRLAMLDAFERDAYAAGLPDRGWDKSWSRLWMLFIPSVDWTGLEDEERIEWQAQSPLFVAPMTAFRLACRLVQAAATWERDGEIRVPEVRRAERSNVANHAYAGAGDDFTLNEHAIREATAYVEDRLDAMEPA